MPQPPPLRLERGERALHLVLRAGADSAATGERKPVTSVVAKSDRAEEQQSGERRRSRAQDHEPEQRDDDAAQGRFAGVDEPAILLTARVVGHCKTKVWRHVAMVPPHLDDLAATPGLSFVARDSALPTQYLAPIAPTVTTTTSMPHRYPTPDASRSPRPGTARDPHPGVSRGRSRLAGITESGLVAPTAG